MTKTEDRILSDFHEYVWNGFPAYRRLCFHPLNEQTTGPFAGALNKAKGVVAGVSDYIVLIACGGFHGLCIEFKVPGGVQSDKQKDFEAKVVAQGYKYEVAYSTEEGIDIFDHYLENE